MSRNQDIVRSFRPSILRDFSMILWPTVLLPVELFLIFNYFPEKFEEYTTHVAIVAVVIWLLFILIAKIKTFSNKYEIRRETLMSIDGFFSHKISEINIGDIRNITVQQSLGKRFLRFGNIGFSTSAGPGEEVTFWGVSNPKDVKKMIQELKEGTYSFDDGKTDPPSDGSSESDDLKQMLEKEEK